LDPSKPSIQEIQNSKLAGLPALAQEGGSKDVSVEYSYVRANPATTGFPTFDRGLRFFRL